MKTQKTDKDADTAYFTPILLVLLIFMSAGWYFAEQDNEILLQELESQHYTKAVHYLDHEGKQHD